MFNNQSSLSTYSDLKIENTNTLLQSDQQHIFQDYSFGMNTINNHNTSQQNKDHKLYNSNDIKEQTLTKIYYPEQYYNNENNTKKVNKKAQIDDKIKKYKQMLKDKQQLQNHGGLLQKGNKNENFSNRQSSVNQREKDFDLNSREINNSEDEENAYLDKIYQKLRKSQGQNGQSQNSSKRSKKRLKSQASSRMKAYQENLQEQKQNDNKTMSKDRFNPYSNTLSSINQSQIDQINLSQKRKSDIQDMKVKIKVNEQSISGMYWQDESTQDVSEGDVKVVSQLNKMGISDNSVIQTQIQKQTKKTQLNQKEEDSENKNGRQKFKSKQSEQKSKNQRMRERIVREEQLIQELQKNQKSQETDEFDKQQLIDFPTFANFNDLLDNDVYGINRITTKPSRNLIANNIKFNLTQNSFSDNASLLTRDYTSKTIVQQQQSNQSERNTQTVDRENSLSFNTAQDQKLMKQKKKLLKAYNDPIMILPQSHNISITKPENSKVNDTLIYQPTNLLPKTLEKGQSDQKSKTQANFNPQQRSQSVLQPRQKQSKLSRFNQAYFESDSMDIDFKKREIVLGQDELESMRKDGLTLKDQQKIKQLQDRIERARREQQVLNLKISSLSKTKRNDNDSKERVQLKNLENIKEKPLKIQIIQKHREKSSYNDRASNHQDDQNQNEQSKIKHSSEINKQFYNSYYDTKFTQENKYQWLKKPVLHFTKRSSNSQQRSRSNFESNEASSRLENNSSQRYQLQLSNQTQELLDESQQPIDDKVRTMLKQVKFPIQTLSANHRKFVSIRKSRNFMSNDKNQSMTTEQAVDNKCLTYSQITPNNESFMLLNQSANKQQLQVNRPMSMLESFISSPKQSSSLPRNSKFVKTFASGKVLVGGKLMTIEQYNKLCEQQRLKHQNNLELKEQEKQRLIDELKIKEELLKQQQLLENEKNSICIQTEQQQDSQQQELMQKLQEEQIRLEYSDWVNSRLYEKLRGEDLKNGKQLDLIDLIIEADIENEDDGEKHTLFYHYKKSRKIYTQIECQYHANILKKKYHRKDNIEEEHLYDIYYIGLKTLGALMNLLMLYPQWRRLEFAYSDPSVISVPNCIKVLVRASKINDD
eukprot:403375703